MNSTIENVKKEYLEHGLVGSKTCIEIVFPDNSTRPSLRTWMEWKKRGMLPYRRIKRRVFYCPAEVRAAIDSQFKIEVTK